MGEKYWHCDCVNMDSGECFNPRYNSCPYCGKHKSEEKKDELVEILLRWNLKHDKVKSISECCEEAKEIRDWMKDQYNGQYESISVFLAKLGIE